MFAKDPTLPGADILPILAASRYANEKRKNTFPYKEGKKPTVKTKSPKPAVKSLKPPRKRMGDQINQHERAKFVVSD